MIHTITVLTCVCNINLVIYFFLIFESFCAPICRLGRLQDSNAVLSHFNDYSEHCYSEVSNDFSRNTRLLKSMKTDLDYVFQKLRYLIVFY